MLGRRTRSVVGAVAVLVLVVGVVAAFVGVSLDIFGEVGPATVGAGAWG